MTTNTSFPVNPKLSDRLNCARRAKDGNRAPGVIVLKFCGEVKRVGSKQTIRIIAKFPLTDGRADHIHDSINSDGTLKTVVDTWEHPWAADIVTWKRGRYVVKHTRYYRHAGSAQDYTLATCELIQSSSTSGQIKCLKTLKSLSLSWFRWVFSRTKRP